MPADDLAEAASQRRRDQRPFEAQHDRVKSDWMSLAIHLGVGGQGKSVYK